ncbi:MAG: hypothetical protein C4346_05550 [Chloroflexota bacterium]
MQPVFPLVAAVPLLFLTSLPGEFSRPLVLAYVLAIVASLAVALTVTPALNLLLLSKAPLGRRESPLVRWLQREYMGLLSRFAGRPRWALGVVGVLVVAGPVMATGLDALPQLGGFLALRDTKLLVRWEGPPDTSELAMMQITARVSEELRSIPGVRNVGAQIGRAVMADHIANVIAGELWVSIDPEADCYQTFAAVCGIVAGYPGLAREVPRKNGAGVPARELLVEQEIV